MAISDFFRNLFTQPTENNPGLEETLVASRKSSAIYNIDSFKNQNFIRSSKFAMQFTKIPLFAYSDIRGLDLKKLIFLCDSIEFPGQVLSTTDYRIPGQLKNKISYARDVNEVNFSFYINDEIPVYRIMSNWIYGISSTSTQNRYFDEIIGSVELTQFEDTTYTSTSSRNAVTNMYVRLIDLYPLNLQSMPSNWADEGYHKVNCSFYFRDIEIV
jgi:hypothetical protein